MYRTSAETGSQGLNTTCSGIDMRLGTRCSGAEGHAAADGVDGRWTPLGTSGGQGVGNRIERPFDMSRWGVARPAAIRSAAGGHTRQPRWPQERPELARDGQLGRFRPVFQPNASPGWRMTRQQRWARSAFWLTELAGLARHPPPTAHGPPTAHRPQQRSRPAGAATRWLRLVCAGSEYALSQLSRPAGRLGQANRGTAERSRVGTGRPIGPDRPTVTTVRAEKRARRPAASHPKCGRASVFGAAAPVDLTGRPSPFGSPANPGAAWREAYPWRRSSQPPLRPQLRRSAPRQLRRSRPVVAAVLSRSGRTRPGWACPSAQPPAPTEVSRKPRWAHAGAQQTCPPRRRRHPPTPPHAAARHPAIPDADHPARSRHRHAEPRRSAARAQPRARPDPTPSGRHPAPRPYIPPGIDMSVYSGNVNFTKVASAGHQVRLQQGVAGHQSRRPDLRGASRAKPWPPAWPTGRTTSSTTAWTARLQADFFVDTVLASGGFDAMLPPVLDVECFSSSVSPDPPFAAAQISGLRRRGLRADRPDDRHLHLPAHVAAGRRQ